MTVRWKWKARKWEEGETSWLFSKIGKIAMIMKIIAFIVSIYRLNVSFKIQF